MSTENQQVQKTSIEKLKSVLSAESVKAQFANALKDHADTFTASLIDLYGSDSNLQKCDPSSVVKEALKAAVLKLPINKALGFAYVIPFNNTKGKDANGQWIKVMEPTFQLGYKGYIQLAMRTGQYRIINADAVFEGEYRTKNKLTGEFDLSGQAKNENIIGYFAHIELMNGFSKTLFMTKEKVNAHALRYSKSYSQEKSVWKTNFDEMAIKTVLRNLLSHYGFLSVEMAGVMNQDMESDNAASEVKNDINENANAQNMSFDDAEIVHENDDENPI